MDERGLSGVFLFKTLRFKICFLGTIGGGDQVMVLINGFILVFESWVAIKFWALNLDQ